ncbi:hypothetical protein NTGM5_120048 [Candidatus Nitrotoga sp. M5]|nr:hypothetical protein NTGM5_120048 [Candidatus Nitrotoga sp. M5]
MLKSPVYPQIRTRVLLDYVAMADNPFRTPLRNPMKLALRAAAFLLTPYLSEYGVP